MTSDISDVARKDPAVVGASGYERNALDFYPTPRSAFDGLIEVIGDDLMMHIGWEPCAGDGAVAEPLREFCRDVITTDIASHNGYQPDRLVDFFSIGADGGMTIEDIAALREHNGGDLPSLIVTNPPYGKDAERVARHALKLMQPVSGMVALLCRHEWDCAKSRKDLFDHPAFAMKITLRHRPRWIADSKGAPRFAYAWYVWDWSKVDPVSGVSVMLPELRYAA